MDVNHTVTSGTDKLHVVFRAASHIGLKHRYECADRKLQRCPEAAGIALTPVERGIRRGSSTRAPGDLIEEGLQLATYQQRAVLHKELISRQTCCLQASAYRRS